MNTHASSVVAAEVKPGAIMSTSEPENVPTDRLTLLAGFALAGILASSHEKGLQQDIAKSVARRALSYAAALNDLLLLEEKA